MWHMFNFLMQQCFAGKLNDYFPGVVVVMQNFLSRGGE